jgi:hypothetical protein
LLEVTDLSYFLCGTHCGNVSLEYPIDLRGLEGWLSNNQTINNLSGFLADTHNNSNNNLNSLKTPIDLRPLSGWFNGNTSILDMVLFLGHTHYNNTKLEAPIDLSPLSGWFNGNTSIIHLSHFLSTTHASNPELKTSINLIPLKYWFNGNRSIADLTGFLTHTHKDNTALDLTGQQIFPNWIETLQDGSGIPIQDVTDAFYKMFSCAPPKQTNDSGEPEFEDGNVLSSLGTPSPNKETYTGRTGFTPASGWQ